MKKQDSLIKTNTSSASAAAAAAASVATQNEPKVISSFNSFRQSRDFQVTVRLLRVIFLLFCIIFVCFNISLIVQQVAGITFNDLRSTALFHCFLVAIIAFIGLVAYEYLPTLYHLVFSGQTTSAQGLTNSNSENDIPSVIIQEDHDDTNATTAQSHHDLQQHLLLDDNTQSPTASTARPSLHQTYGSDPRRRFFFFQLIYLTAFLLSAAADWIQDPFLYEVFDKYNIDSPTITLLYIVGFISSLTLGTYTASLADYYGRKKLCLFYCFITVLSNVSKNSPSLFILGLGRICGGIGLSLLWSCFESWCVSESRKWNITEQELSMIFTNEAFYDALIAIAASFVGHWLVKYFNQDFVAPFNFAALLCAFAALNIYFTWDENYGEIDTDNSDAHPTSQQITKGIAEVRNDPFLIPLGAIGSGYEAIWDIFLLAWTPSLEKRLDTSIGDHHITSHGLIFATFMLWSMVGSLLCKTLLRKYSPDFLMGGVLLVSIMCFAIPMFTLSYTKVLVAFCGFCFTSGFNLPCIMLLRSIYIRDEVRATVTSLFRIPLNIIVAVVLFVVRKQSDEYLFFLCVVILMFSFIMYLRLEKFIFVRRNKATNIPSGSQ